MAVKELKTYLNKKNKQFVIITGFVMSMFKDMPQLLELDGELKKKANTLATMSANLFHGILQQVDQKEAKALFRAARHNELALVPKSQFILSEAEHDEAQDTLYTIAEYAIGNTCATCTKKGGEVTQCELRTALIEYAIPYAREGNVVGCPYRLGD